MNNPAVPGVLNILARCDGFHDGVEERHAVSRAANDPHRELRA